MSGGDPHGSHDTYWQIGATCPWQSVCLEEAEDTERLAAKLKKTQAKKFAKEVAALQG